MSKPVSALGGMQFEGLVKITELPPQGMVNVRGDLDDPAFQAAVAEAAGVAFPGMLGASCVGGKGVLWMAPDEVMILAGRDAAAGLARSLAERVADMHALVVDVSDARSHFEVQGRAVRDVLAKLAPLDMAPEAFPMGQLRRTRFAQVAAGVWLRDNSTAQVFCFRSVAQYMADLLSTAADEAASVGYFDA